MPISVLITSPALTAINLAKSPTVTVSGTANSRRTGSVGIWKPCSPPPELVRAGRAARFGLRRFDLGDTCNSSRPYRVPRSLSSVTDLPRRLRSASFSAACRATCASTRAWASAKARCLSSSACFCACSACSACSASRFACSSASRAALSSRRRSATACASSSAASRSARDCSKA